MISPEPAAAPSEDAAKPDATAAATQSAPAEKPQSDADTAATAKLRPKASARVQARRGRPPGKKAGEAAGKEKVTLRLNKELMDDYREWSWEERCQLGELVERAMQQYHQRRSRQKSQ